MAPRGEGKWKCVFVTRGSRPNASIPRYGCERGRGGEGGGGGRRGGVWKIFSTPYSRSNDTHGSDEVEEKGDGTKGREGRIRKGENY